MLSLRTASSDLEWLKAQEGQNVQWLRVGQSAVPAKLIRASDLMIKLNSGEFVRANLSELAFAVLPPQGWGNGSSNVQISPQANPPKSALRLRWLIIALR